MATPAITMIAAMIAKFGVQKKCSPMMSLANDLHGAPKPSISYVEMWTFVPSGKVCVPKSTLRTAFTHPMYLRPTRCAEAQRR